MKKFISIVMCMLIIFFNSFVSYAAVGDNEFNETEDNNSIETANILRSNYTVNGKLTRYDMDFYQFTLTSYQQIKMLCVTDESSLRIGLKDSSGETFDISAEEYRGNGIYADTIVRYLPAGTYYFMIINMDEYAYNNTYMFYFEILGETQHKHSYATSFVEPTCTDNGYTIYSCSCGESYTGDYVASTGHSYGEWIVVKEATTNSEGEETRTCSLCGETETRTIPKLDQPIDEPSEDICGDVNGDGAITAVDARIVLQTVAGLKNLSETEYKRADVNGDGVVTAVDARMILQIVAGLR